MLTKRVHSSKAILGFLATVALLVACSNEDNRSFALTALDVNRVPVSLETPAILSGRGFFTSAHVNLDSEKLTINETFQVVIGGVALSPDSVTLLDAQTLQLLLPSGLSEGLHDVVVTAPSGARDTLVEALLVAEPALQIEDADDGSGDALSTVELTIDSSIELFALSRWPDGQFFRAEEVSWVASGGSGTLVPGASSSLFSATGAGSTTITVDSEFFGSAVVQINSAECFSPSDCSDPCRSGNTCANSICVEAPVDKDSDGDGFIDIACGGLDCDDSIALCGAACSPGLSESDVAGNCLDSFDNDCDTAFDAADSGCGNNTPPIADLIVSPGLGLTGSLFDGDASSSFDIEEPAASLSYSWDWDGDGVFEATGINSSHSFMTPGQYEVVVRVEDGGTLVDYNSFNVLVVDASDLLTVTTETDENDSSSTPASPGGTGFSLREAIQFSNATAGRQSIFVPAGFVTDIVSELPALTDATGTDIVGDGVIVDGGNGASRCMSTGVGGNRLYGLNLRNCTGACIDLAGTDTHIARGSFSGCGTGIDNGGSSTEIGPNVEVFDNLNRGIRAQGGSEFIHDSRIHDNPIGVIVATATNVIFRFNVVYANGDGLQLSSNAMAIHHCVFHGQTGFGATLTSGVNQADFANNIVVDNAGGGLDARTQNFSQLDFSLFSGNTVDCTNCTIGANSVSVAPDFIDLANDDYRILLISSGVDAGIDLGLDRNGAEVGLFFGTAPDMGATEAQ